ncbi:MAG: glycyl-radical enzyme activating protein [bacterium]
MSNKQGVTFNVQRFSTEDGPGIRTTVFMKGCPLKCAWCHNPEGISFKPQLVWYDRRCIGARDCLKACPENALKLTPKGMIIARSLCTVCGLCADACPAVALEVIGRKWTAEALVDEALKDVTFYRASGGGVTISGGEPLAQPEFVKEFMASCRAAGLHVALDTSGFAPPDVWEECVRLADLVLLDLKTLDESRHREYTGVDLAPILDNARRTAAFGVPVWVRTPVIPGYTDSEKNIREIAEFAARHVPTVERHDLLSFSNLCTSKYERLETNFPLRGRELLTKETMERLREASEAAGMKNAVWSGPTRIAEKE